MKRSLVLAFIFWIGTAWAQNPQVKVPYTRFTLPNGLTVILHEDHSVPLVSVNTYYHVGSGREKPGRTGFAHLFEHLMFEGSGNVPEGKFDEWLEAAGGDNNGSTNPDRTNYWMDVPRNAMELPLFLESDRMAYLLKTMTAAMVDLQRNVVKNERRQSYENRPYGMSSILLSENLYPPDHPYHWPTIGSMEDLSAASFEDVVEFFKRYYGPNNASLVVGGDIDPVKTRALVEKWFSEIPAGPPAPPFFAAPARLTEEKRLVLEDKVQLPRIYMAWLTPGAFAPGDAELDMLASVLASGKNSRLYKRLVYDLQIAQDVSSFQATGRVGSSFRIIATARAGHTLSELEGIIQEEIDRLKKEPPTQREVQRVVNQIEADFLSRMERVGGFGGKADQLNHYYTVTGNPDYFNEDLARYKAVAPEDISNTAQAFLPNNARVILSVVPMGKKEMSATSGKEQK